MESSDRYHSWSHAQLVARVHYLQSRLGIQADSTSYIGRQAEVPCDEFVHSQQAVRWRDSFVARHQKNTLSGTVIASKGDMVFYFWSPSLLVTI